MLLALAASLTLAFPAVSRAPERPVEPEARHRGTGSPEDADRLAAALAAIEVPILRSDLAFLADDEMRGRDTPSPELRVAALFLVARLERLGFESAGSGNFFYEYSLHAAGLDSEGSELEFRSKSGSERLAFGQGSQLNRMSHAYGASTDAPVVSVGAGSKDEFERADVEGAWALLFDEGVSVRRSMRYAAKNGAVGILFAETDSSSKPYADKFARTTVAVSRKRTTFRKPKKRSGDNDDVPIVMLDRTGVARLLSLAETESDEARPAAGVALGVHAVEKRVVRSEEIPEVNVAGFWPGRDPELANEVIIVSAHYDHVGATGDDIYNGADDNASGTTGLLGVAEALAAYGPMRRSVLLLWVSGEEKGLWGSEAWSKAPQLPDGCSARADINIDMIGRTATDELYITPTDAHASFNAVAQAAYDLAGLEGFESLRSQDADWNRSDHYNFDRNLEIPVAFLSAGEHPDYHQPTDTVEKIDFEKLARITRLVVRMLDRLEDGPLER